MTEQGREIHPDALEFIELVRGVLGRERERDVLGHCVTCRRCLGLARALGALRRARGLGVRDGLEPTSGRPTIH